MRIVFVDTTTTKTSTTCQSKYNLPIQGLILVRANCQVKREAEYKNKLSINTTACDYLARQPIEFDKQRQERRGGEGEGEAEGEEGAEELEMLIKNESFTRAEHCTSESHSHHSLSHNNHRHHQVDGQYHRAVSPSPHDNAPTSQHDNADENSQASLKGHPRPPATSPIEGCPSSLQSQLATNVSSLTKSAKNSSEQLAGRRSSELANEEAKDFITLIHFNDCYNIEPGPKSSGAAGFLTAVNQYRHLNPIILFSGDILSPSFMSTFTKGEQMIPVLNDIGVHCAVFGNHEFDYGVDNLIEFTKRTTFPWLLSNVVDKETSGQLGDGLVFHTIERAGVKFGLIGLIEEEWLSTLSTLDSSDVIYEDFVTKGRELARWLKGPAHQVDIVIALTHFRTPNDIRLADSVPEIDLILGGHDHDYEVIKRPNCHIVKSGTDFREFSLIKLKPNAQYLSSKLQSQQNGQRVEVEVGGNQAESALESIDIERIECISYPPDEQLRLKLEKFVTTIDEKMGKVLGQFNCELDGRFSSIRKYETNLGNFVTDIMLASTHADLAILNSGTLRSDRVHARGDFTMRDLFNILGYIDPIAVLRATGFQIWKALENGVSQWPKLEGRFPQVSGCSFLFDPSKPPLARIDPKTITIGDEQLDLEKDYKLTTKAYLASGKDGYDILKECEILVPGDESPDLTTSILNHFEAINIVKSNRRTHHRQSIICLSRSSIKKLLDSSAARDDETTLGTPTIAQELEQTNNKSTNDDNNNQRRVSQSTTAAAAAAATTTTTTATMANGGCASSSRLDDTTTGTIDEELLVQGHSVGPLVKNGLTDCCADEGPSTSSPLVGSTAPTPTLGNMAGGGRVRRCGSLATPPSTIPRQTRQPRTKRMMSLYEMEHEQCKLEPQVEGRIKILGVNWPQELARA